jgi:hypothetical protein
MTSSVLSEIVWGPVADGKWQMADGGWPARGGTGPGNYD